MNKNQIYETTRYNEFTFTNNRSTDTNKAINNIKRIRESMRKYGWLGEPICVSLIPCNDNKSKNYKYYIESGQHRFISAKEEKIPVRFCIIDPFTTEQLMLINTIKRTWNAEDTVDTNRINSNTYQKLKDFVYDENTNLKPTILLRCLGISNINSNTEFMNGNVVITNERWVQAEKTKNFLQQAIQYIDEGRKDMYQRALVKMSANCLIDEDRMLEQLKKFAYKMTPRTNVNKVVEELEMVYNFAKRSKDIVSITVPYKRIKGV